MPSDLQPEMPAQDGPPTNSTDKVVVKAPLEVEHASAAAPSAQLPVPPELPWFSRTAPVIALFAGVVVVALFTAWGLQTVGRKLASAGPFLQSSMSTRRIHRVDVNKQAEVEGLLERIAAGDSSATDEALAKSEGWTGQTHRSPKTDQFITVDLNSNDMRAREAAIQTQLAIDGVTKDQTGLHMLKQAAANPKQRMWALWMLGALGNRGVDSAQATTIIASYLNDPDVNVRAAAVNGLGLVGTDETIPLMLDRFRNDPSPMVQERAACSIAESGMYTHEQRMVAASNLVGWLDDSLLTTPQRAWTVHALSDISGQNFGQDSAAWHRWYDANR